MIEIQFTEDEVATMAYGCVYPAEIRDKFTRALPPVACQHCSDDPLKGHACPSCGRRTPA